MMKLMRNALLVLLCVMLSVPAMPIFAATTVISESFDGYDAQTDFVDLKALDTDEAAVAGDWKMVTGSSTNLLNTNPRAKIAEYGESDNKVVEMQGTGANAGQNKTGYLRYAARYTYLTYTGSRENLGSAYKIKFDFEKSHANNGFGIKFAIDEGKTNYYILWFLGNQDYLTDKNVWEFHKIVNNNSAAAVVSDAKWASASSATEGTLVEASVEIIVNKGSISWSIDGFRNGNVDYHDAGSFNDATPHAADPQKTHEGFYSSDGGRSTYLDNFAIENLTPYEDYEPVNALYVNLTEGQNISEFNAAPVRRIYLPSAAGSTVSLTATDAGGTTKTLQAQLDAEGWWVNLQDSTPFVKVEVPANILCDDMLILTEKETVSETVFMNDSKKVMYPKINGNLNAADFTWTSSDETVATVDANGVVFGIKRGEATITATHGASAYMAGVTVKGEMDVAVEEGTVDAYLADKKPVMDAMNQATTTAEMEAILTGNTNTSLGYIKDINKRAIDALSPEELTAFAARMLTYKNLKCEKIEDIETLQNIIDCEIAVGLFVYESDAVVFEENLGIYGKLLGLNTENTYYVQNKDAVIQGMLNAPYDNQADLKNTLEETYVMIAFKAAVGYVGVADVTDKCENEIGYDKAKYAATDKVLRSQYLLENKADINTLDQLKTAIDTYQAPVDNNASSSGTVSTPGSSPISGGGGGGGSFGGGGSLNSYDADREVAENANKVPFEDNTPIFDDVNEEDWYYEAVAHMKGIGAVNGYEGNSFMPEMNVTRAEFVKMLISVCGLAPVEAGASLEDTEEEAAVPSAPIFADVTETDWHHGYLVAAYENGLIFGDENQCANPDSLITREEMATMMNRAMILLGYDFSESNDAFTFTDDAAISEWAYASVTAVKNAGFINGCEDGSFRPHAQATRAEAAKVLSGFAHGVTDAKEAAQKTQAEGEK